MLTRLRVSGFKNLEEVDVYFGPFTCIAGGNAVGKSNLFDAIMFLGAVMDMPLLEAAMAVRDKSGKSSDVRSLFRSTSRGQADRMSFEAEMIVPSRGIDDLGQTAKATTTLLRYRLDIEYRSDELSRPSLQIVSELLDYISLSEAAKHLPFERSTTWLKSVVRGRRTSPFVSTVPTPNGAMVRLHQDGRAGRAREFLAASLPRTVLSTVNAVESPTALLARREMQSWRLLQLEPSALRASDPFTAPTGIGSDGSHLASTLYALAKQGDAEPGAEGPRDVMASVGAKLAELVDDIRSIHVERDDKRELFTLMVTTNDGTTHAARSLSDGTLRFLALAVLAADPKASGVICLEEPENGIHPERVTAILRLLMELAVDTHAPIDEDNPLRQLVINTHSPAVVAEVPDESLLFAETIHRSVEGSRSTSVSFLPLPGTWRARFETDHTIQRGRVMAFLDPIRHTPDEPAPSHRRVIDRPEFTQLSLLNPGVA